MDLSKQSEAIDDLDQVIEISAGNVRAYASRALAYANLGQDAKAREDTGRTVELGADRAALDRAIEEIKKRR